MCNGTFVRRHNLHVKRDKLWCQRFIRTTLILRSDLCMKWLTDFSVFAFPPQTSALVVFSIFCLLRNKNEITAVKTFCLRVMRRFLVKTNLISVLKVLDYKYFLRNVADCNKANYKIQKLKS